MKVYISYFNNFRNFNKTCLPISTAMWDPKWFHDNKDQNYKFIDNKGIINGIKAYPIIMTYNIYQKLESDGNGCSKGCPHINEIPNCAFMDTYRDFLNSVNFEAFINRCYEIANNAKQQLELDTDMDIIFLVHEKPSVPCSERPILREWLEAHDLQVEEWAKD